MGLATRSSAAPLVSLDAGVLDTETTGPDAAAARVIQIGAVRIFRGEIAADRWFAGMAAHMAEILDTVGIAYCTGGVKAKNDDWRHTVSGWKRRIDDWISRSYALDHGCRAPDFAKLLAATAGDFGPPIGFFGGLQTENGRVDRKPL